MMFGALRKNGEKGNGLPVRSARSRISPFYAQGRLRQDGCKKALQFSLRAYIIKEMMVALSLGGVAHEGSCLSYDDTLAYIS